MILKHLSKGYWSQHLHNINSSLAPAVEGDEI